VSDSRTVPLLRVLVPIAACVAVLGLAACGDDEETTSSPATVPTETTDAETTDAGDTDSGDLPDASALREQFNQQLLQVLTTTQNLTQAQAECAIEELESTVSDDELQQAIEEAAETGQPPQDLIDSAFDAGASCAEE
jgi:hypothetical protein